MADITPSAVIIVATVRALKYNGGVSKTELNKENFKLKNMLNSFKPLLCGFYIKKEEKFFLNYLNIVSTVSF